MPRKLTVKGIKVGYDKGSQLWRIRFNIKKQRWSESHPTRQLAEGFAEGYGRRLLKGEDIRPEGLRTPGAARPIAKPIAKPGTVRAEASRWLVEGQRQRKRGTNGFYTKVLVNYIYPALGDLPLTDAGLTRKHCLDFARSLVGKVSTRTGRPLTFYTRQGIITTLSAFCQWACDEFPARFPHNPATRLRKHIRDADELPAVRVVWTHEEAHRLLEVTRERQPLWYRLLQFAIHTGLRMGEIMELQWELDFGVPGHVSVSRQYQVAAPRSYGLDGTGQLVARDDPHAPRVVPTKGKRTRLVPLRPETLQALEEHRAEQRKHAFKHGRPVPPLTFTGPRGGHAPLKDFEWRILPLLCKEAKVPVTSKFHTTRHTFATVLLHAGVELSEVAKWLGHASTMTTEQHYKHYIRDTRRDQAIGQLVDAAWRVK